MILCNEATRDAVVLRVSGPQVDVSRDAMASRRGQHSSHVVVSPQCTRRFAVLVRFHRHPGVHHHLRAFL